MILKSHFILYVEDQEKSTGLYTRLFDREPDLFVPGMTEFHIGENIVIGLMPKKGITRITEGKFTPSRNGHNKINCELYFLTSDITPYKERALKENLTIISDVRIQDWGHKTFYFTDYDNNVIVFAENIN